MNRQFHSKSTGIACIFTLAGCLIPSFSTLAQGTLNASTFVGSRPRITINGANADALNHVKVEFSVKGASSLSGPAAQPFLITTSGTDAGLFSMGTLVANGMPAGTRAIVIVRAWDTDSGATFSTASLRASTELSVVFGSSAATAAEIVFPGGFKGLDLVSSIPGNLEARTANFNQPRIQLNGVNALPADNIQVEFLVEGASSLSGLAATPFPLTLTGVNAGLFSRGLLTVNGIPAGATGLVTVRAWDLDSGATFNTASVRRSATFPLQLGSFTDGLIIPTLPATISKAGQFPGLNLGATPPVLAATTLAPRTVLAGAPVTFSTSVVGFGTLTFRWTRNGILLPGANSSSLSIAAASRVDAGTYAVTVTDGFSTVVQRATLTVNLP